MNPQNGIIGDISGTELPEAPQDNTELIIEKKRAKFSKSEDFKEIEAHFRDRIKFYQQYLPDGRPIAAVPKEDLEGMWVAANVIIAEFETFLASYNITAEAVNESSR